MFDLIFIQYLTLILMFQTDFIVMKQSLYIFLVLFLNYELQSKCLYMQNFYWLDFLVRGK